MDALTNNFARRIGSILLVVAFAIIVIARIPTIVFDGGRFWAEEGVVYFAACWSHPWYVSWFTVAADAGYINFAAGFGTWLGLQLGGLMDAPRVTVAFALLIQCLPVYVIITHDFPWRRSLWATMVAVLFCAIAPVTGEVWLNTITSQFQLALAAALIFAAPARRPLFSYFDCLVLAFAVMSGPATSFLMPLFVLAAFVERRPIATVQAAIVFTGFLIQVVVFLLHPLPERGSHFGPAELLSVISLHVIVLQVFGLDYARDFARYLGSAYRSRSLLWSGPLIFLIFYTGIGWGIVKSRSAVVGRLMMSCLVFGLVSFYEAWAGSFSGFMHVLGGQRYAFAPEVLDSLLVLGLLMAMRGWARWIFVLGTLVLLFTGITNFRRELTLFAHGPAWRPQVIAWRHNPALPLAVWPGLPWAMSLPARQAVKPTS